MKIHGMLCEVSPMKKGKGTPYFDGKISDGRRKIRLFGFDNNTRKRLTEVSGSAIVLANCEVKKGRYGDDYEVRVVTLYFMYICCTFNRCVLITKLSSRNLKESMRLRRMMIS